MSSVDFYILPDQAEHASDYRQFACRLAEKAWGLGKHITIQVDDANEANRLNTLLWTFRDASFVPHQLENETHIDSPVLITWSESWRGDTLASIRPDLLINLSAAIPSFYSKFDRIAEIVSEPEQRRQQIRQHYSHYKRENLPLQTHQM